MPGVAGTSIEILGIYLTGHNYNANADNIRLGYWDGVSGGDFATGGLTVFRGWAQGASNIYSPEVLIDDTRGWNARIGNATTSPCEAPKRIPVTRMATAAPYGASSV